MTLRARLRLFALDHGGLLALVALVLYLWLAPHHVVDGDNAEFATLSVTGGAAHPSGYPLYIVWLRVTSWLPGASPAHTAALATAVLGATTLLVLHAACRAWGARPPAATIAVAIFATSPVVLRVVTEAEVFALNNLAVATVLWLAAHRGPVRGAPRALVLGLVAGLALSNHLTCVLVAPVGILGVVRAVRESRRYVAMGLAMFGLALGLVPYGYLLIAPDTPMSWGAVRDLERLFAMFMREDYGGPTAFRAATVEVSASRNVAALLHTLGRAWLWLPLPAALAALVLGIARPSRADHEPRVGWLMLAVAWLVAGPLLVLRFNVPPEGLGLYVNQRFHLLPALLLAIPVAVMFDRVQARRPTIVVVMTSTIGFAALAATALPYVGRVHSPAVEAGARNLLYSLPEGAVVIHSQDELHAVPGYVQWALGERQDIVVVTWPLMTLAWYRERVAARGITSGPGSGTPQMRLVESLMSRGRPVFVDRLQRDLIGSFPSYPHGVLMRVLPRGTEQPPVLEVYALNRQLFASFALDYPRPGPADEFATEVHARYAATWSMIGRALETQGHSAEAAEARQLAEQLAPR